MVLFVTLIANQQLLSLMLSETDAASTKDANLNFGFVFAKAAPNRALIVARRSSSAYRRRLITLAALLSFRCCRLLIVTNFPFL